MSYAGLWALKPGVRLSVLPALDAGRCAYCGGQEKEQGRSRCLSCGAPWEVAHALLVEGDVSHEDAIRIKRWWERCNR